MPSNRAAVRRSEVNREQSTWTSTQPAILHISDWEIGARKTEGKIITTHIPRHRNTRRHTHRRLHSFSKGRKPEVTGRPPQRWNVLTVAHPLQEILEGLRQFAGLGKKNTTHEVCAWNTKRGANFRCSSIFARRLGCTVSCLSGSSYLRQLGQSARVGHLVREEKSSVVSLEPTWMGEFSFFFF